MEVTLNNAPLPFHVVDMGEHLALTLHLSTEDRQAIGGEVALLTEWFNSALRTLVALRTGKVSVDDGRGHVVLQDADADTWYWGINTLVTKLEPRLAGIRDAAIRKHAAADGSIGNLGFAMDVERSTAQYRRDRVLGSDPQLWETWATGGGTR